MITPKKLMKLAKKWQKLAASKRKRIPFRRTTGQQVDAERCSTSSTVAEKGQFVVYTADKKRFVMPLAYLQNNMIGELFQMAEDEFGLPSSSGGRIMLPCDAVFMEYVVSLIQKHPAKDVDKALPMSIATSRCLPSSLIHQHHTRQQSLISSF